MNDAQTCDLCAGKCRGHSLGRPEQWEPEVGSLAHAQAIVERLTDAQKDALRKLTKGMRRSKAIRASEAQCGNLVFEGLAYQGTDKTGWYYTYGLTPFGITVRKLLEKQNG